MLSVIIYEDYGQVYATPDHNFTGFKKIFLI